MEEIIVEINYGYLPANFWINGKVNPDYLNGALPEGFMVNGKINEDLLPDVNFKGVTGDGLTEDTAFTFDGFSAQKVDGHLKSFPEWGEDKLLQGDLSWVTPSTGGVELPQLAPDPLASVSNIDSDSARLTSTVVPDAQNHNWYVANNIGFSGATLVGNTAILNLSNLTPETTYYARVRAVATGYKATAYSNVITFQTSAVGVDPVENGEPVPFSGYNLSAAKGENDNDVVYSIDGSGNYFGEGLADIRANEGVDGFIQISGVKVYSPADEGGINGAGKIGYSASIGSIGNPDTQLPYSMAFQNNQYGKRIFIRRAGEDAAPYQINLTNILLLRMRMAIIDNMINYLVSLDGGVTYIIAAPAIARPDGVLFSKFLVLDTNGINNIKDARYGGGFTLA